MSQPERQHVKNPTQDCACSPEIYCGGRCAKQHVCVNSYCSQGVGVGVATLNVAETGQVLVPKSMTGSFPVLLRSCSRKPASPTLAITHHNTVARCAWILERVCRSLLVSSHHGARRIIATPEMGHEVRKSASNGAAPTLTGGGNGQFKKLPYP